MKNKIKIAILVVFQLGFILTPTLFAQSTTETPLISAVLYKDISEIEKLLAEGVDINQQDKHGYTALIRACSYSSKEKYSDAAKLLILKGADVNIHAKDGNAAVIEAAGNSREIFDLLLEKGADFKVKKEDGTGAYYQCMLGMLFYGREGLELADFLLSKGVNVDEAPTSTEIEGYTPLIFAARDNNKEVVNFLIEHGANVSAKNVDGQTPLSLAEKAGNNEIVEILKAHGAK